MTVDEYRREYRAFQSDIESARYRHCLGDASRPGVEEVYDRYRHLFTTDAIENLKTELTSADLHIETERVALKALYAGACVAYCEVRALELTRELSRCESSLRVEWMGTTHSIDTINNVISEQALLSRRRELYERWADTVAKCDDLRAARLQELGESARGVGFTSYGELRGSTTVDALNALATRSDALLAETERSYESALADVVTWALPGTAFRDLHVADAIFLQNEFMTDNAFPADKLKSIYADVFRDLGIRVWQQQNIRIPESNDGQSNQGSRCFAIVPPDDVRIVAAKRTGVNAYARFFHASGHAQLLAWSSRDLAARYPEFIYPAERTVGEGFALLFSQLFLDETWLLEHFIGMSEKVARRVARQLSVRNVFSIRKLCARLRFDLMLRGGSEIQSEKLAHQYSMLHTEATRFRFVPACYLSDDRGMTSGGRLRAHAFVAGLREYLFTRHGNRWWSKRRVGDELIDMWNTSSRYSLEELAKLVGFEVDIEFLAHTWNETLQER